MKEKWYENPDKIVTICGSLRFYKEMRATEACLGYEGYMVFSPVFKKQDDIEKCHMIHNTKILMSSKIIVVCPGNYIGKDTKREIDFAAEHGIDIEYFDDIELRARGIDTYSSLELYKSEDIIEEVERRISNGKLTTELQFIPVEE